MKESDYIVKTEKAELSIKELCKKYDNIIPLNELKKVKIPLLGIANCTK